MPTPEFLNTIVTFDSEPCLIVGIMPADFQYPLESELWVSTPGDRSPLADAPIRPPTPSPD